MFHVDLPIDTQVTSELSPITVTLLFIHKIIGCVCTKQDQEREQGFQLPVSHTLSDHNSCHGVRPLERHVKNGSFSSSSMNCMSMESIIEVFYHLNKILIATKHIADNNFVFQ